MKTLALICSLFTLALAAGVGCGSSTCHDDGCDSHNTGGAAGAAGSSGATLAEQYCDCLLLSCHDDYHAKYGPETDEPAARAACLSEAASVPVNGSATTSGNFIECRLHHCQAGKTDPASCASSVGGDQCQ